MNHKEFDSVQDFSKALCRGFSDIGDRTALRCEGEEISGGDVLRYAASRSAQINNKCDVQFPIVGVFSGRGNAFWMDCLAVWLIGGVVVPLLDTDTVDAIADYASRTSIDIILGNPAQGERCSGLPYLFVLEGPFQDETMELPRSEVGPDALAMLTFTSGSTARPKIVPLTRGQLLGNARGTLDRLPYTPDDVLFAPIPFQFISSISHFLCTVLARAQFWGTEKKFVQGDLIAALNEIKPTAFGGSPLHIRWIVDAYQSGKTIPPLRWGMVSGDALAPALLRNAKTAYPDFQIIIAYGLTEVAGRFCIVNTGRSPADGYGVGQPIEGLSATILDDSGNQAPDGELGQVLVKGPLVFKGYLNASDVNAKVMRNGGFRTGDMGHLRTDGTLELTGRSDDVFKSSGLKVSAVLIAQKAMELGLFRDAVACPEEMAGVGVVPVLYAVPKPVEGEIEPPLTRGKVLKGLRGTLPDNHLPRALHLVESIPRTGSGKLDRKRMQLVIEAVRNSQL